MIAKITHGSSIYGAVSYNQKKVDAGAARVINTHNMIVPREEEQEALFRKTLMSFEPYLEANKRTKKTVMHVSLNPSEEDNLDDYKLAKISDDYMKLLGYGDQPYIVYLHTDINRKHIHIVSLNINSEGIKLDDSYQKRRSEKICRDLEIKYRLKQILDEKKEDTGLYLKKINYISGDIKRQISNTTKSLTESYNFQSFGEFNALLSIYNIHSKQVRGEQEGNFFNGVIYSAATEDGTPVGTPVKSSSIGKMVGYEALERKMKRTTENIKNKKLNIRQSKGIISEAMDNSKNRQQFISLLKNSSIDVIFRENEEGRIYGVTFIDHKNKSVFNGSRLGKEFSANTIDKLFGVYVSNSRNTELPTIISTEAQFTTSQKSSISVDEMFGTFYLDNSGYDIEEELFMKKLKRKKKQNRRKI